MILVMTRYSPRQRRESFVLQMRRSRSQRSHSTTPKAAREPSRISKARLCFSHLADVVHPVPQEMPALDRLQGAMGGPIFRGRSGVHRRGGIEKVRAFYGEIGVSHLAMYLDVSGQAVRALGAVGLPTTLVINRAGQEVGRVIGPAEWDSSEIADILKPSSQKQSRHE